MVAAHPRPCVATRTPVPRHAAQLPQGRHAFLERADHQPGLRRGGALINFVGVQADVTAQVHGQEALRQSELRFSRMTANVPGMVYQLLLHDDGTADFPYVSEGCRELFGLEPAQMRPDACTLLDRIHAEDIGEFLQLAQCVQGDPARPGPGKAATWPPDGEIRWLQGAARPEKRGGSDTLWDGLLLDITTRKRAEQEIQDRARQAAAVAELGQRALGSDGPSCLAQAAAEVITRTLGTDLSMVTELLPGGKELDRARARRRRSRT